MKLIITKDTLINMTMISMNTNILTDMSINIMGMNTEQPAPAPMMNNGNEGSDNQGYKEEKL